MGIQVESREIVVRELARVKATGDPDGVEWEVYVLNRDLEETPRGLPLAKGAS
ncbi:MAG: hypothetical protein ACREIY_08275 [Candidatus Rokuibacteriota bacterium]